MKLYTALVSGDGKTHLTSDAEKTLCRKQVIDLPQRATTYCDPFIDMEYTLGEKYVLDQNLLK